ncbi:MAG TPA: DNA-binding domain-containing protein [Dyella sp.]|uniref:DNA-binding domain-containing protein n=1 Tax=Dyella sp. TaxID=1869338 RepID=UPI002C2C46EF|nr:DNA-binding domain-containing protein [Dyella sp.]HTV85952.1 DNA-binding domain-containing protein [Dyella sp.]
MTPSLASFQDAFVDALYGRAPHDSRVAAMAAQPGFAVYRNTVFQGCVDALEANFPAVMRLVGKEWFRAAAAEYAAQSPPTQTQLLHYGNTFPDFLAAFEPAESLPYLPGVARLDYFWVEAHSALDEAHVTVGDLAAASPQELERARLRVHPAARWRWFAHEPAYTIWRANREGVDVPADLVWEGEGALLARPSSKVVWQPISIGACAFLDACADGCDLESAANQALGREPGMDLGHCVSSLLMAGAIAQVEKRPPMA